MKTEYIILIILFIHWVADFLFQTKTMVVNKSKNNYWLLSHVFVYSIVWVIIGLCLFTLEKALLFGLITFMFHFLTDYFTSKLYKEERYYGFPSFFSVIGLDQYLHYLQLILTYAIVIGF